MGYMLYGDGIHDDYPAIQEMIDSGVCEVYLPVPEKHYLISKTLVIPSNFRLVLPRYAEIKLADGASCLMVRNQTVEDYAERVPEDATPICKQVWHYLNEYSPDAVTENIEICGGIWNFNNMNQIPNPERSKIYEPLGYSGDGMLFYGVKNMKLSSLTLKDPIRYGVTMDRVSYFTVEDITFDYNLGNPQPVNMDGIHLNGNCHFGVLRNLKGACYDDLVALNAREGSCGPITNIEIDGIFAENCHSAVRLLTVSDDVKNIHISNVYGTYYQFCIAFTKFYPGETTGVYDGIMIDHIYASKALRDGIYPWKNAYVYPLIVFREDTKAKNVKITDVRREEYNVPIETIHIAERAEIETLILDNIVSENHVGEEMPMVVNNGKVHRFVANNLCANGDPEIVGEMCQ